MVWRGTRPARRSPGERVGHIALLCLAGLLVAAGACRAKGYRAHRFPTKVDSAALHARYGDALYSQDDEETLIRAFFDDRRNGVFLDVGAGDPVKNSTTYYLEKHLGWHGIAVDALAEYAADYARWRPATRFFSYFVGGRSGEYTRFLCQSRERTFPRAPATTRAAGPIRSGKSPPSRWMICWGARASRMSTFFLWTSRAPSQPRWRGSPSAASNSELACVEIHSAEHGRAISEYFTLHGYREITAYRSMDPINRYFAPAP